VKKKQRVGRVRKGKEGDEKTGERKKEAESRNEY